MDDGGLEADGVAGGLVEANGNGRLIGFLLGYQHAPKSRIITQREPRAGEEGEAGIARVRGLGAQPQSRVSDFDARLVSALLPPLSSTAALLQICRKSNQKDAQHPQVTSINIGLQSRTIPILKKNHLLLPLRLSTPTLLLLLLHLLPPQTTNTLPLKHLPTVKTTLRWNFTIPRLLEDRHGQENRRRRSMHRTFDQTLHSHQHSLIWTQQKL